VILQILQRAASTNNPVRSIPQIVEEASSTFSDEVAEESVRTLVARMAADPDVDVERVARGLYRITDAGDADGDETEEVTLVATELKKLIEQAEAEGGLFEPDGYRSSALALVDAVFSARAHYNSVINVVQRTKDYFGLEDEESFTISVLLQGTNESDAPWIAGLRDLSDLDLTEIFRNRTVTPGGQSSRGAGAHRYKARLVVDAAERLLSIGRRLPELGTVDGFSLDRGLDARSDFLHVAQGGHEHDAYSLVERDLLALSGMGVATVRYLWLLLGAEFVKPDRMICRWIQEDALGGQRRMPTQREAASLLEGAVATLNKSGMNVTVRAVDHLVWQAKSGRRVLGSSGPFRPGAGVAASRGLELGTEVDLAARSRGRDDDRWHGVIVGFDDRHPSAIVQWNQAETTLTERPDGRGTLQLPYFTVVPSRDLVVCHQSSRHPRRNDLPC
jgi:hypothetical protein